MIAISLRHTLRRWLGRVLTVCVTLVVAVGLIVVWAQVVETVTRPDARPKAVGQPDGLVWDGRVFTSPHQVKAYLTSHGLSYSRWATRHPTAFGGTAPTVTTPTTKKTPKPAVHRISTPRVTDTTSRTLTSKLLTALLLIGGIALALSAAIPSSYAPVAVARFYADPGRRTVAFAAAAAILLGFGVSSYLP